MTVHCAALIVVPDSLGWTPELAIEQGIAHSLEWFDVRGNILADLQEPAASPR